MNKKFVILILSFYFGLLLNAQELCFKIDSVLIYSLPLNLNTTYALTAYEVRNFDKKYLYVNHVSDSLCLEIIANTINNATEYEISKDSNNNIDVRIVLDVFYGENSKITLLMNNYYSYYLLGAKYKSDIGIINFLKKILSHI